MNKTYVNQEINGIREKIIDYTLVIGSILGCIAFAVSLLNYNESLSKVSYIGDFTAIGIFVFVSIFRKKIGLEIKSIIIIAGLFLLVVNDILKLGIYSDSKLLFIIIPFFSFLVYSLKRTIVIYSIGVIVFLLIGYLFVKGILIPDVNASDRINNFNPWLINILLLSIVSFIIVLIVRSYNQTFENLIRDLEDKNIKITQSEQNYREIFNSSSDAIFIHDLKGNILDVNDAMLNMYGLNKKDMQTVALNRISSEKDGYTSEQAMQHFKNALKAGIEIFDWQARRKNDEIFWVEVALKKTHILGKTCVIALVRDIDDKKNTALQLEQYKNKLEVLVKERTEELEDTNEELVATNDELYEQREELQQTLKKLQDTQDQLIQVDKMASLGVLASGVAHEINNPLNFIRGGVIGIEGFFYDHPQIKDDEVKPFVNAIDEGVERASNIVKSLNHFSRQNTSNIEDCEMHEIIDHCLVILNPQTKNSIQINKDFTEEKLSIKGNAGKLHQALLNILSNAEQAIPDKGIISIKTRKQQDKIAIHISDSGIGIDKMNLKRITEPFFTTKDPGKGTGLGLSITYKIIQEHKGDITFESELNKGTSVKIELPSI